MIGPYAQYDLPTLLSSMQEESAEANTAHLNAWSRKLSLLKAQIDNLTALLETLNRCWDPSGSEAAQKYADYLKATIISMTDAHAAARTVRQMYSAASDAILSARRDMEALMTSYQDQKAAWRSYLKTTPAGGLTALLPESWDPGPGLPPAVSDTVLRMHQDKLDAQARTIMERHDAEVAAAREQQIDIPALGRYEDGEFPPPSQGGTNGTDDQGGTFDRPVFNPPPPSVAPGRGLAPVPIDLGPFLTSVPPQVSPPVLSAPPSAPVPSPVAAPVPPFVGPRPARPAVQDPDWITRGPSGQRVMRSGGVIEPISGPATRRTAIGPPIERPGVIGAPSRTTGRGKGSAVEHGERNPSGGWRDRSYEAYARRNNGRKREGDNQWQMEEGVPPILEAPAPPPPNDPTPGVIGIDR